MCAAFPIATMPICPVSITFCGMTMHTTLKDTIATHLTWPLARKLAHPTFLTRQQFPLLSEILDELESMF